MWIGATSRPSGAKKLIFGLSEFITGSLPLRGNPAGNQRLKAIKSPSAVFVIHVCNM